MAKTEAQILAKLDRPPAAHNFALCNHPRESRTINSLVNLALGFPIVSYQWAQSTIQLTIADALDDATAISTLQRNCPESQWEDNIELLLAFLEYNKERQFQGHTIFPEWSGTFIAGPNVSIPVRPTAVLRENGMLKPLFVIGWANNRLSYFQRRMLTAIFEDAIFSLTDFQNSPGEVLIFPRNGYGVRRLERWDRQTYLPLTHAELIEQVSMFIRAREAARLIIPEKMKERAERKRQQLAIVRGVHPDERPSEPAG